METEFKVAAKWWADILRADRHPRSDIGAPDLEPYFAFTQSAPDIPEHLIAVFEGALADVLNRAYVLKEIFPGMHRSDAYTFGRGFGTDYEPKELLSAAAQIAGVDISKCLPAKTIMWVQPGAVKVKQGYGAPIKYIYGSELSES